MERLNERHENITQLPDNNGGPNFPPFKGDIIEQLPKSTEMKNPEEIHNCEIGMVAEKT